MRASNWLIWVISWLVCRVTADPYTAPHTSDELHDALANLGVQITGDLPVPPDPRLQSNATAPSHHCAAAVSAIQLHSL